MTLPRAHYTRADGCRFLALVVRTTRSVAYIRYRDARRTVRAFVHPDTLSPL